MDTIKLLQISSRIANTMLFSYRHKADFIIQTDLKSVADPEICPRWEGGDDLQNLWPHAAAIFFLTSFNRGWGAPRIRYWK